MNKPALFHRLASFMGWTRSSYVILGAFLAAVMLIIYVWWPLAQMVISYIDWGGQWWRYMDWLLVGIFLFMTLVIMARADLRTDALIVLVGAAGGLVIEGWGTQTYLWWYFTAQRPPLWIIPAWPIASLTIDRMVKALLFLTTKQQRPESEVSRLRQNTDDWSRRTPRKGRLSWKGVMDFKAIYWLIFPAFCALMLYFVWPTMGKSLTLLAVLLVVFLILTPTDHRFAVLTFAAGSALGYFLERWGTTRECWTYYTLQKPPLFAVLAHGMAAVAFWRAGEVMKMVWGRLTAKARRTPRIATSTPIVRE
jgi:hypothetical protein